MALLAFIMRRLAAAVVLLFLVGMLSFLLFHEVGDPVAALVGVDTAPDERLALRRELGLEDPLPLQLARHLANLTRLELGLSYQARLPVAELIAERLPATLELALVATVLAHMTGVPLGVLCGSRPRAWYSRLLLAVSLLGIALPTFLTGMLLTYLFAVELGWLPAFGRGQTVDLGFWTTGLLTSSGRQALVLPASTLALFQAALLIRLVRAQMIEVLGREHIRFARARGLSAAGILWRHALPNALLPVIAVSGLQLGSIIAFALITESVFQWPGMGLLFLQAVQSADIPIMAAYLPLTAILFLAINLAADLVQRLLDPRLRGSRATAS